MSEKQTAETGQGDQTRLVLEHARRYRVPIRPGRRCVDGRYAPGTEDSGRLARPGSDFGYILLGLAAHRAFQITEPTESWVYRVYQAVVRQGGGFSLHTDRLSQGTAGTQGISLDGCAHIRISREEPRAYQVNDALVDQALEWVLAWAKREGILHLTMLEGIHEELGVLILCGESFTVESNGKGASGSHPDEPDPGMYFIYDLQRDLAFLSQLSAELALTGDQAEWLKRLSIEHAQATLCRAMPGIPLYLVQMDLHVPSVTCLADSACSASPEQLTRFSGLC